jgi:hypothetical protein
MSLDFPAAGEALWAIADATGARPEYLLPVLANESGLDPSIQNRQGAPYYGIAQNGTAAIAAVGATPDEYLTWSASKQLAMVVLPYFQTYARKYGQFGSGIRVYQAEYYPASLGYARGLDDIIVAAPSQAYNDNSQFDVAHKGYITPRDLGATIATQAAKTYVQNAIAQTYALRPGESPKNSVYGTDFSGIGVKEVAIAAAIAGVIAGGAYLAQEHGLVDFHKIRRSIRSTFGLA